MKGREWWHGFFSFLLCPSPTDSDKVEKRNAPICRLRLASCSKIKDYVFTLQKLYTYYILYLIFLVPFFLFNFNIYFKKFDDKKKQNYFIFD